MAANRKFPWLRALWSVTYRTSFADKPRNQADAGKLANICDKLGEIRRQMVDMSFAEDSEMNQKNLDIVTEQLVMFEGEFEAVVRAQTSSTTTRPVASSRGGVA